MTTGKIWRGQMSQSRRERYVLSLLESSTEFEFAPFLGKRASSFNHNHFCFHARTFYDAKTCVGYPENQAPKVRGKTGDIFP